MYKVVLYTSSGKYEYLSDSFPDFEDMSRGMKYIHGLEVPTWLMMAGIKDA
jgi:hypothetical protein